MTTRVSQLARDEQVSAFTWVAIVTICLVGFATSSQAAQYVITDLGALGGSGSSTAHGINASGQVTGGAATSGDTASHAFLWSPTTANGTSGSMIDLGTLGGSGSEGHHINDSGLVTGSSRIAGDTFQHAFMYDGATMVDLGTLGGTGGAIDAGWGINNSGLVTGGSFLSGNTQFHAFLYDGTMHDLGTLGGNGSVGLDINDSGQVTGDSHTNSGFRHAFIYDGTMHDIGTLGGSTSRGSAINASGQVTGEARTSGDAELHAFLWTPDAPGGSTGTMLDLGALGDNLTSGLDVNEVGDVVGNAFTISGDVRLPFLYTSATGMVDLNTLIDPASGWQLFDARGINDAGQIVGGGVINGEFHAYLLTPVPEPNTLMLTALCLLGVLKFRNVR